MSHNKNASERVTIQGNIDFLGILKWIPFLRLARELKVSHAVVCTEIILLSSGVDYGRLNELIVHSQILLVHECIEKQVVIK